MKFKENSASSHNEIGTRFMNQSEFQLFNHVGGFHGSAHAKAITSIVHFHSYTTIVNECYGKFHGQSQKRDFSMQKVNFCFRINEMYNSVEA